MSVPREILKWLQSLDLSFSIKNPKRDFRNGFIIAEILARYFPSDIEMHTYDSGNKESNRKDNWNQLSKVFKKRNLNLVEYDYNKVVYANEGAAVHFIQKLYQSLTKRELKKPPPKEIDIKPH